MIEIRNVETGHSRSFFTKQEIADFLADRPATENWEGYQNLGQLPAPSGIILRHIESGAEKVFASVDAIATFFSSAVNGVEHLSWTGWEHLKHLHADITARAEPQAPAPQPQEPAKPEDSVPLAQAPAVVLPQILQGSTGLQAAASVVTPAASEVAPLSAENVIAIASDTDAPKAESSPQPQGAQEVDTPAQQQDGVGNVIGPGLIG